MVRWMGGVEGERVIDERAWWVVWRAAERRQRGTGRADYIDDRLIAGSGRTGRRRIRRSEGWGKQLCADTGVGHAAAFMFSAHVRPIA